MTQATDILTLEGRKDSVRARLFDGFFFLLLFRSLVDDDGEEWSIDVTKQTNTDICIRLVFLPIFFILIENPQNFWVSLHIFQEPK